MGHRLVLVVSRPPRRTSARNPRRAGVHPLGCGRRGGARALARNSVARSAPEPEPRGNLRDVLRVRLRTLFLHHMASDISAKGSRIFFGIRGLLFSVAVDCERGRLLAWRLIDRLAGAANRELEDRT